jgi:hypothetical protein
LSESETGTAAVTVSDVEPETDPEAAEIVVLPPTNAFAIPVALIAATPGIDELQTADCVRSWIEPSLYVPVAENCKVYPCASDELVGVTAMLTSAAWPTLAVVEDEIDPDAAVTVAVPNPEVVARPALLITSSVASDVLHVAMEVTSCADPSV